MDVASWLGFEGTDTRESYSVFHPPAPDPSSSSSSPWPPAPVWGGTVSGSSGKQSGFCWHAHRSELPFTAYTIHSVWLPTLSLSRGLCVSSSLCFSSEHVKLKHMDLLILNIADLKKKEIVSCFEIFRFLTYLLFTLWFIWPDSNLHKLLQLLSDTATILVTSSSFKNNFF